MRKLNTRLIALTLLIALSACASTPAALPADFPAGDAERGAALYGEVINGAPSCVSCHTLDGSALNGPSLQNYAARAGARVDGQSAEVYTYISLVQPAAHVVSGYANVMYSQYDQRLSAQQIADLMAYLLTL